MNFGKTLQRFLLLSGEHGEHLYFENIGLQMPLHMFWVGNSRPSLPDMEVRAASPPPSAHV